MLGDIGQRLGDHEVGDRLHRGRHPPLQPDVEADRQRGAGRDAGERRIQPAVLQHHRMQAADQVAQLGDGGLGLLMGVDDHLHRLGRHVLEGLAGQAEVHRQRDQPLLGAVVQIPLDPAALGIGRVDHAGPALGQIRHPLLELAGPARAEQGPRRAAVDPGYSHQQPGRGEQQGPADQREDQHARRLAAAAHRGAARHHPAPADHRAEQHTGAAAEQRRGPEQRQQRADHQVVAELPVAGLRGAPGQQAPRPRRAGRGGRRELRNGQPAQGAEPAALRPRQPPGEQHHQGGAGEPELIDRQQEQQGQHERRPGGHQQPLVGGRPGPRHRRPGAGRGAVLLARLPHPGQARVRGALAEPLPESTGGPDHGASLKGLVEGGHGCGGYS